ncbi:MAG TPA: hypothetical protein VHC43_11265 [Mycobacteriales bacterium]|nr:hypothetical protein [Mycobacteriales bacterium]HVV76605.1 hypothetical protein [Mycobacteriales bacterium]
MSSIPKPLTYGPFTVSFAGAVGVSARSLQSKKYQRLFSGVYADARLDVTTELLARGIGLVLPKGAVVGGTTAALLHGADVRRLGDDLIYIVTARADQIRRRGVRSSAALLEPSDVTEVHGVPCLSAVRVAFDLARDRRLVEAVVGVDAMLNRGGCRIDHLKAYVADHPGWRGVRFARAALGFVEPLSESVMESRQRMALVLAGLPRPRAQVELADSSGHFVARLDHGYDEWKVGLDYDGEVHAEHWRQDLERQERIRDLGWWHRRYTSLEARGGWGQMVAQVRAALRVAGWRPGEC